MAALGLFASDNSLFDCHRAAHKLQNTLHREAGDCLMDFTQCIMSISYTEMLISGSCRQSILSFHSLEICISRAFDVMLRSGFREAILLCCVNPLKDLCEQQCWFWPSADLWVQCGFFLAKLGSKTLQFAKFLLGYLEIFPVVPVQHLHGWWRCIL